MIGRRRTSGDDGVVAVLVAVLMIPVLLGVGALAVDVGGLYADRQQQQNAADAGALAVARQCLLTPATCISAAQTPVAQSYASDSAGGKGSGYGAARSSHVDQVCFASATCGTSTKAWDCRAPLPSTPYVQVRTSSGTTDESSSLLPPRFARALTGHAGDTGYATHGCARAIYGTASFAASSIALTISACDWAVATNNGASYAPSPPYTNAQLPALLPNEVKLSFHGASGTCPKLGPSGLLVPGGFGHTTTNGTSPCTTVIDYTQTPPAYDSDTGNSLQKGCDAVLLAAAARNYGQAVYLPVFATEPTGNGANAKFALYGFAAFVLTGYRFPSATGQNSWLTGTSCGKSCLSGFFTRAIVPAGTVSAGGQDLGADVLRLVG